MIYTIGRKEVYDSHIAQRIALGQLPLVLGQRPYSFMGSLVFQTRTEAQLYIARNSIYSQHTVYGVHAKWEIDTYQHLEEPHHRLLVDAKLERLD